MKEDGRGKVIEMTHRMLPRNANGDPAFESLGIAETEAWDATRYHDKSLLSVFSPAEIVVLVNRALYQAEYQRTAHRQRAREEQEMLKDLKAKVKELFGVAWIKATPEQVQTAAAKIKEEMETK